MVNQLVIGPYRSVVALNEALGEYSKDGFVVVSLCEANGWFHAALVNQQQVGKQPVQETTEGASVSTRRKR